LLPNLATIHADAGFERGAAGRDFPRGIRRIAAAPRLADRLRPSRRHSSVVT